MLNKPKNKDEENIIVKKIEGPSVDDEYTFEEESATYFYEEPKQNPIKMILLVSGGIIVGVLGYLGFSMLNQKENSLALKDEISVPKVIIKTEEVTEITVEKESNQRYLETLAIPIKVEEKNRFEKKEIVISSPKKEAKSLQIEETHKRIESVVAVEKLVVKSNKIKKVVSQEVYYEKIKPRIVSIKKGDTLATIAKRFYGDITDYNRIVRANSRLKSAKTSLHLGEKIVIPRKDKKTRRRYIIVQKGNTMALLSEKFYGDINKVSKIIRANYKIKNRHSLLHLGQKVYLPR